MNASMGKENEQQPRQSGQASSDCVAALNKGEMNLIKNNNNTISKTPPLFVNGSSQKDVQKKRTITNDLHDVLDSSKADSTKSLQSSAVSSEFQAPDGGFGWVVVFSSFSISLLVDGLCFSQGVFLKSFATEFGTELGTTSWISSVLNGTYMFVGPVVSALTNIYGCRRVAFCGAILATGSLVLSTFSPNFGVMVFTYGFLGGLGFGMMYLPAIVMVGYCFDKRRALATGIAFLIVINQ